MDRVLLNAFAKAVGLGDSLSLALLPGEKVHVESAEPGDPVQAIVQGKERVACVEPDGACGWTHRDHGSWCRAPSIRYMRDTVDWLWPPNV